MDDNDPGVHIQGAHAKAPNSEDPELGGGLRVCRVSTRVQDETVAYPRVSCGQGALAGLEPAAARERVLY